MLALLLADVLVASLAVVEALLVVEAGGTPIIMEEDDSTVDDTDAVAGGATGKIELAVFSGWPCCCCEEARAPASAPRL